MLSTEGSSPFTASRPDLQEFLTALNGFLSKPSAPADPRHLHFLEIFFRSVNSDRGHLLKVDEEGNLSSVVSYGIGKDFDREFNEAHSRAVNAPCPLDVAFNEKDAIAIVDIPKEKGMPEWFMTLMKKYRFSSLVAVPLLGADKPVGILCAYYNDICLFDRATLNHLIDIGKMVGGATEKSLVADMAKSNDQRSRAADMFLEALIGEPQTQLQVFSLLCDMLRQSMDISGVFAGPLKAIEGDLQMTVAAGHGIPESMVSRRLALPVFLSVAFRSDADDASIVLNPQLWGILKSVVPAASSVALAKPVMWGNQPIAGVVAWRDGSRSFNDDDQISMRRMCRIAALALHVK